MKVARLLAAALLAGGTVLAATVAWSGMAVTTASEPRGISLREESARGGRGFFAAYRTHRGGGLHGGK